MSFLTFHMLLGRERFVSAESQRIIRKCVCKKPISIGPVSANGTES